MQNFIIGILIKVLTDPNVQASIEKLLGNIIAKQILPLIPVAVGAAVKAGVDELITKVPGIEGVVDVVKTTESAVSSIESIVGNIPVLGDILKNWGVTP